MYNTIDYGRRTSVTRLQGDCCYQKMLYEMKSVQDKGRKMGTGLGIDTVMNH
jgi:hypothetical protein